MCYSTQELFPNPL